MEKIVLRLQGSPAGRLARAGLGRAGGVGMLLALAAGLSTCGPDANCLTSTGPITTERRALPAGLRTVYAYDNVDLILVQEPAGTVPFADVRGGRNLLGDLQTQTSGDQLRIRNTATCNWARSYGTPREVTLHVPSLRNVSLFGAGNVSTAGEFRQDTIFFHLTGAGDYTLDLKSTYLWVDLYELGDVTVRGSAGRLQLTLGGNGRFFGQNLRVKSCYFGTDRDSNGDAQVQATDYLAGTIRGNGTLYYSGDPAAVGIQLTGHGQAQRVP